MSELYERIANARSQRGLTLEEVGRRLGISAQAVHHWEKPGGSRPSLERLIKLADVLAVSLDYLLRGAAIDIDRKPVTFNRKRYAPVLNRVAAGQWGDVVTPDSLHPDTIFLELVEEPIGEALALEIDGESMLPEFRPGDIIIIDTGLEPQPGDYVVAVLEAEQAATFKKFRLKGVDNHNHPIIDLVPLNPDWPTLTLDKTRPGKILGTMIEHRRLRRRVTSVP